ncbi:MAG: alpha-2-macroglobulin, partial [Chitinophagales bacterium]
MKSRIIFLPALLVFFALSCTNLSNTLKLDHTNFTQEIVPDQNLSFTFASDLVPDSLTQKWDTVPCIKFTPAVNGKFKWDSPNELIFSPEQPFPESADFTAELTDHLFSHSKTKMVLPKEKLLKFHTPYLMLGNAQMFYMLSQKNPGAVEIKTNVVFNCKVKPADLKSKLHLFVNEKEVQFNVIGGDPDYSIGVMTADLRGDSKEDIPLKIQIDPGLACAGSSYTTKEKMEFTTIIPTKEKLMVTQMAAIFLEGNGQVTVATNQPIVNENINSLISVNPSVTVTAEKVDNGFVLKGNFEPDKSYAITISKTLKGIFGYALDEDYTQNVSFGEVEPTITFADQKGLYISSRGAKNLAVNIASVNTVKVQVARIYENNILDFMRAGQSYGDYYDSEGGSDNEEYDESRYHDYNYYDFSNYGDAISEKQYTVSSLPKQGNVRLLNLNPDDLGYSDRFKGIYLVKVQDEDRQWLQETKIVSLSDIGLIVRQSDDEVYVFTNSILTTEALSGVKVNFISTNNQNVTSVSTDKDGVAVLKNAKAALGKFNLGMITCSLGDDFNFMILGNSAVSTSRFEVGGKYLNDAHLDCFIYGDRDIYRPGDSVHMNTIIRTEDWQVMKDVPMKVKLLLPSGKEFQSFKKTPDAQGSFETSFYMPTSNITGTYTMEVLTANDVYLAGKQFSVEEFVPDRIKVVTQLDKQTLNPTDKLTANITATNLFGPPAANRNYEVNLQLNRKDFFTKKYSRYNFNIQTPNDLSLLSSVRNGKTDENGKATEVFEMPDYTDVGIIGGSLFTTVFDETGRPVHQFSSFEVKTQDIFFGIKYFDNWVDTRTPLSLQFIGVNKNGQSLNAQAEVDIYRFDYETVIEQTGGRYQYNSQRKEILVSKQNLNLTTSGGVISFTPYSSGEYEIRILRPRATTYVADDFYAYGWNDTRNTSFEVDNEGEVDIQLDKESYNVGDKANVLLKSPFEGKILLTVERGSVLEYHYLNTKEKAASISIPVKDEFLPNVFITATAFRKMSNNQLPLTVARGYVPLKVVKTETKIPVAINSVESSRSKTKQHIQVKTAANAELTIAVVDEGILQLKNTPTPDPYNFFYQQRALQMNSYDLYPFLLPEYSTAFSNGLFSGDMAEMMKNRTNPFSAKRFNLVALWSGILKADGGGNASFDVNIPQFSGALRVMAVAYKDNTFGSADEQIKVADPIVISTALPRFFSPGDEVKVPITLANTTSKNADVKVDIAVSGPLSISGSKSQSTTIKSNSEGQVEFAVLANSGLGAGNVTVTVNGLGEKFTDQTDIAVRPASTLTKQTGSGVMNNSQSQTISLKANMIPESMSAKLVISKSPMTEFSSDLRYLIQYPYGCVEQTVSAAFPQLYYRDLAKAIGQENKAVVFNPDYNVQQAIKKLESMQLYNGAISYW